MRFALNTSSHLPSKFKMYQNLWWTHNFVEKKKHESFIHLQRKMLRRKSQLRVWGTQGVVKEIACKYTVRTRELDVWTAGIPSQCSWMASVSTISLHLQVATLQFNIPSLLPTLFEFRRKIALSKGCAYAIKSLIWLSWHLHMCTYVHKWVNVSSEMVLSLGL